MLDKNGGYARKSIESKLLKSRWDRSFGAGNDGLSSEEDDDEDKLFELLKLCLQTIFPRFFYRKKFFLQKL